MVANGVSALLLLAILLPLGWRSNTAAEHLCHRFARHLLRSGETVAAMSVPSERVIVFDLTAGAADLACAPAASDTGSAIARAA
jgi:hypothetical protein